MDSDGIPLPFSITKGNTNEQLTLKPLEQKLIVTYSIKYRDYQRKIRNSQIDRAVRLIETNPSKLKKSNQNDYKRFIQKTSVTSNGKVAEKRSLQH